MNGERPKNNRALFAIAALGIAIELVAIVLLATERVTTPIAMAMIPVGMFMAFVPIFAISRRARRR